MKSFRAAFDTHSPAETVAAGEALGASLHPGLSLVLDGDMGAGKTTLVKGIALALTAADPEDITSPTFTLMHEYRGTLASGDPVGTAGLDVVLYHLDLYRLEDERQVFALGLNDIRSDPSAILLVEWGEKFPSVVDSADGRITLTYRGGQSRHIAAEWRYAPVS